MCFIQRLFISRKRKKEICCYILVRSTPREVCRLSYVLFCLTLNGHKMLLIDVQKSSFKLTNICTIHGTGWEFGSNHVCLSLWLPYISFPNKVPWGTWEGGVASIAVFVAAKERAECSSAMVEGLHAGSKIFVPKKEFMSRRNEVIECLVPGTHPSYM